MLQTPNAKAYEKVLLDILASVDEADRPSIGEWYGSEDDSHFIIELFGEDVLDLFCIYSDGKDFNATHLHDDKYKLVFVENGREVVSGFDWKDFSNPQTELKQIEAWEVYKKLDLATAQKKAVEFAEENLDKFKEVIEEQLECKIKKIEVQRENKCDSYPCDEDCEPVLSFIIETKLSDEQMKKVNWFFDDTLFYEGLAQAYELPSPLYASIVTMCYALHDKKKYALQVDAKVQDFEAFVSNTGHTLVKLDGETELELLGRIYKGGTR